MTTASVVSAVERPRWRSVAIPNEHGGWGLTAEPVLLGLLVAPSWAGLCLGVSALLAFLVRTPLKLISIDVRHDRWIDRSRLAAKVAAIELGALFASATAAVALGGWDWLVPVALAAPLVALEWIYDSRGRGRRLIPELAGAIGIAAVTAAIVIADAGPVSLAAGLWLVLGARAIGSIPFIRVQIARLRRGAAEIRTSDVAQAVAGLVAVVAVLVDDAVLAGATAVGLLALTQVVLVRRSPVPAKQAGLTQMVLGFALVLTTAVGVLAA